MAFPESLDPTTPVGTDSPASGDDEFRALKQFIVDVFGTPASPSTVAAAASKMDTTGQWPVHVRLTNQTGGSLAANDVVQVDTANNSAVVLGNTIGNGAELVVARETITNTSEGLFSRAGVVTVATVGTVTRGDYIRKSATTKVAETTSVAASATSGPPPGAFAVALTTASGNTCTALLLGRTGGPNTGARGFHSTTISAASNAWTDLTVDSERWDNGGLHSTSSNTERFTAVVAGKYLMAAGVGFPASADYEILGIRIVLNNTTVIAEHLWIGDGSNVSESTTTPMHIATVYSLAATDYLEAEAFQKNAAAAAKLLIASSNFATEITVQYLGP
jgi:hypothetical protein